MIAHRTVFSLDQDSGKGAMEQDEQGQAGNISMSGQLGHRDENWLLKFSDTDFPEPGGNPEHSGERQEIKTSSWDDAPEKKLL